MKEQFYKRKICPAFEIGVRGGCRRFYIEITYSEDGRLSLCGKWHSQGQNYDELSDERLVPAEGYEHADLFKIQSIWKRWHLNDMRAGTPKQEEFVRGWLLTNKYDYTRVCEALEAVGLLVDDGYKYGTSWLKEEVPTDILRYLFTLPAIEGNSWNEVNPIPVSEEEYFNILNMG